MPNGDAMDSHPNYRGYDALKGKPDLRVVSNELAENLAKLGGKDLPDHCPQGLRFAISPYEWQIAKVFGDGFTIVLWNSKIKGTKRRRINPTFEGEHSPDAAVVMSALAKVVA